MYVTLSDVCIRKHMPAACAIFTTEGSGRWKDRNTEASHRWSGVWIAGGAVVAMGILRRTLFRGQHLAGGECLRLTGVADRKHSGE